MNTFKVKPGEWEDLTKEGIKIHFIQNNKEISQYFALAWHGRKRVLVALTESEYDEKDPLEDRRHGESDPI